MKTTVARGLLAAALGFLLAACVPDQRPDAGAGEVGVFSSRNPGSPIPLDRIKGLDEYQLTALFGPGTLDRKDDPARALRYTSDACQLFVYLYRRSGSLWKAEYADAYDLHLRPLPVEQCAGSVAAQKPRAAA